MNCSAKSGVIVQWDSQGVLDGNSFSQPCEEARNANAVFGSPVADALSFSESRDYSGASSVPRLAVTRKPLAVLRHVAHRVITSVYGMVGSWSSPHVCQEVGERVAPPKADRDTSSSVILEARAIRIMATVLHGVPNTLFGCFRSPMGKSQLAHSLCFEASARRHVCSVEIVARGRTLATALADAFVGISTTRFPRAWNVASDSETPLLGSYCEHAVSYQELMRLGHFGVN